MKYAAYMMFDGKTRQAVEFYKGVFNGEITMMQTFGESPQDPNNPLPEEMKDLIMHANLQVGEQNFMFSDGCGQEVGVNNGNITIALTNITAEEAFAFGDKLKVNGKVNMEVQETFWSKAFGNVTDQFGITWQISADK